MINDGKTWVNKYKCTKVMKMPLKTIKLKEYGLFQLYKVSNVVGVYEGSVLGSKDLRPFSVLGNFGLIR